SDDQTCATVHRHAIERRWYARICTPNEVATAMRKHPVAVTHGRQPMSDKNLDRPPSDRSKRGRKATGTAVRTRDGMWQPMVTLADGTRKRVTHEITLPDGRTKRVPLKFR